MIDWTKTMLQARVRLLLPHNVTIAPEEGEEWSEPFTLEATDIEAGIRPDLWISSGVCRMVQRTAPAVARKGDKAPPTASEPIAPVDKSGPSTTPAGGE